MNLNKKAIEQCTFDLLKAIGEDPNREGLKGTPRRVSELYAELFEGLEQDPSEALVTSFSEVYKNPVIMRDIPFYSTCEHHFLPFFGIAHIGYIPKGRVIGASKLVRVLEILARRPQIQERLTNQVADVLFQGLESDGVAVVIVAEHLCMTIRGVRKAGIKIVTSVTKGPFETQEYSAKEFLELLYKS